MDAKEGVRTPPWWLSRVDVAGVTDGEVWNARLTVEAVGSTNGTTACPTQVHHLDAAGEMDAFLGLLRKDRSREDLFEGVDPGVANQDFLDLASYLLRRRYNGLRIFEIGYDDVLPFFEAETEAGTYSSFGMGRGEVAALYMLWRLFRLEPGDVLLLDEPESHLAVYSHEALVYVLAKLIAIRDVCVICSSHNPHFFSHLSQGAVNVLSPSPLAIESSLSPEVIAGHLGAAKRSSQLVLLTEDPTAAYFLAAILEQFDHALTPAVTVSYHENGESGVRGALQSIRSLPGKPLPMIAVLDGDQRTNLESGPSGALYLPGRLAPERVLEASAAAWRRGELSWTAVLAGGDARLRATLGTGEGLDHHDWLQHLSDEYGSRKDVIAALTSLVLLDGGLHVEAEQLVAAVRDALHRVRA